MSVHIYYIILFYLKYFFLNSGSYFKKFYSESKLIECGL